MTRLISRRQFIVGFAAVAASAGAAQAQSGSFFDRLEANGAADETGYDPALLPPPESEVDYPVEPANLKKIPRQFHRQIVDYFGAEPPGTIIVDPGARFLYHIQEGGEAIRYGVGVGRAGFAWAGEATVYMKRRWPRWVPPREMVARDKNAMKWANGQPGGPDNPLGARALYLHANGVDTLYRIHGTNDPSSIGKAISSGCIRLLNQDIAELFLQVPIGTRVVVIAAQGESVSQINENALPGADDQGFY